MNILISLIITKFGEEVASFVIDKFKNKANATTKLNKEQIKNIEKFLTECSKENSIVANCIEDTNLINIIKDKA